MPISFLNGLSEMGKGIEKYAGTAGLELQKTEALKQLQQGQQTFTGGENEKNRAAAVSLEDQKADLTRQQAVLADQLMTAREHTARTETAALQADAPTDQIKLLRELGVLPKPGATKTTAEREKSAAPPSPDTSGDGSVSTDTSTGTAGSGPATDMGQAVLAKVLGIGQPGSEEAIRMAIAKDVKNDPVFKYKSAGQQATEIENRLAVAGAKIGSSESLDSLARQIASYDLSPLDARARMVAGGPGVMAKVKEINPSYNEANYAAVVEAKKAITPGGTLFVPISAMETSLGHASHFLDIATQLGNYGGGNWTNIFPNKIASNTGAAPLVNALTQTAFAMAEEGNRIYAGNAGTEGAINNWAKTFPVNGSLADQVGAVKNFAQLMGDKFDTMAYHLDKTFKDSGIPPVELLSPKGTATLHRLTNLKPDGKQKPDSANIDETSTLDNSSAAPSHPPLPPGFRVIQ